MNYFLLILGFATILLVLVRLVISIQESWQRVKFGTYSDSLSLELLQQKIASAKREYDQSTSGWNGYRKFQISKKTLEAKDVCSFYLKPHDGKSITSYRSGQYLTFRVNIPGREKPVIRCYSISDCFCEDHYRVTIKKVMPRLGMSLVPPGLVSSYFHEQLEPGDLVDVQAPSGGFFIEPVNSRPAVLIAGGVGITPILSMAKTIIAAESAREFFVFYGVRSGNDHAFKDELEQLEESPNCRVIVCYSNPSKEDLKVEGQQYQHHGWVSVELMRSYLRSTNYDFYICGPPPMMKMISDQLANWGVSDHNVFTEAFGPATIKKVAEPSAARIQNDDTKGYAVKFSKSGIETRWKNDSENLLDLAEEHGVQISSGCRAGNCGTCTIGIKSGSVDYQADPGATPENGSCLACIAVPSSDLILDA